MAVMARQASVVECLFVATASNSLLNLLGNGAKSQQYANTIYVLPSHI